MSKLVTLKFFLFHVGVSLILKFNLFDIYFIFNIMFVKFYRENNFIHLIEFTDIFVQTLIN